MKFLQHPRARCAFALAIFFCTADPAFAAKAEVDPLIAADATGTIRTYTASGDLDTTNPFFQVLGTNGRTPDMPLYTLRNNATGALVQTTDPGRALITGKWADIGKFKGPVLRGLAARPPYFHNGTATTLGDAVDFYDTRFNIGFSAQEKKDLVAFLNAL